LQASTVNSLLNTPLGFAVFFLGLWCTICFLISFVGGWFTLSRHFKKDSEPFGETKSVGPFFYAVYTRFWSNYGSVIRMTAADDALYLSVLFLFRVGHPPLRIPWNEIEFGRTRFLFRRYVVLTLGSKERIPMRISERMARNLGIQSRVTSLTPQI